MAPCDAAEDLILISSWRISSYYHESCWQAGRHFNPHSHFLLGQQNCCGPGRGGEIASEQEKKTWEKTIQWQSFYLPSSAFFSSREKTSYFILCLAFKNSRFSAPFTATSRGWKKGFLSERKMFLQPRRKCSRNWMPRSRVAIVPSQDPSTATMSLDSSTRTRWVSPTSRVIIDFTLCNQRAKLFSQIANLQSGLLIFHETLQYLWKSILCRYCAMTVSSKIRSR